MFARPLAMIPATPGLEPWSAFRAAHAALPPEAFLARVRTAHLVIWTPLAREPQADHFGTIHLAPVACARGAGAPWAVAPVEKRPGSNAFGLMITLGRAANNDVVLPHGAVSKFHAYLRRLDGSWLLSDAGSLNGTAVNGVPLPGGHSVALSPGDRIVLGGAVVLDLVEPGALRRLLLETSARSA